MLDKINSLSKDDLIQVGKKYKILGHLSNFTNPYLSEDDLRLAIIKKIEEENPLESGKMEKKRRSKRQRSKKMNCSKRLSKKQQDYGYDLNFKIGKPKSYYKLPDGAKIIAIGDIHGDLAVLLRV